jgi:hypothetical protein
MEAQRMQVLPARLGQEAFIERAVWQVAEGFYIEEAALREQMTEAERAEYDLWEKEGEAYEAAFGDPDDEGCKPLIFRTLEEAIEFDRLASRFANMQEENRLICPPDGLGARAIEDAFKEMEAFIEAHAIGGGL